MAASESEFWSLSTDASKRQELNTNRRRSGIGVDRSGTLLAGYAREKG